MRPCPLVAFDRVTEGGPGQIRKVIDDRTYGSGARCGGVASPGTNVIVLSVKSWLAVAAAAALEFAWSDAIARWAVGDAFGDC